MSTAKGTDRAHIELTRTNDGMKTSNSLGDTCRGEGPVNTDTRRGAVLPPGSVARTPPRPRGGGPGRLPRPRGPMVRSLRLTRTPQPGGLRPCRRSLNVAPGGIERSRGRDRETKIVWGFETFVLRGNSSRAHFGQKVGQCIPRALCGELHRAELF